MKKSVMNWKALLGTGILCAGMISGCADNSESIKDANSGSTVTTEANNSEMAENGTDNVAESQTENGTDNVTEAQTENNEQDINTEEVNSQPSAGISFRTDKLVYQEGDEPIFIYIDGNFIGGYLIAHIDGTLTHLNEEEYVQYCKNYCDANNKQYYDHFGKQVRASELATFVAEKARNFYPNDYIAAQHVAIDVNLANSIPEDIYWYDINRFEGAEDDGYHYYIDRGDMTFHRVSEELYQEYLNMN